MFKFQIAFKISVPATNEGGLFGLVGWFSGFVYLVLVLLGGFCYCWLVLFCVVIGWFGFVLLLVVLFLFGWVSFVFYLR